MNLRHFSTFGLISALVVGGTLLAPPRAIADEQGYEELTRGPVHEAFAETVNYNPEPGILVQTAPPEQIEEVPPDERPDGENVTWIPGYWGWDGDQKDFIWISGVWRNLPPGRQWVPGYWAAEGASWQWTSGYWADETQEEVTYLPKPPQSIETGPNIEAPSKSSVWVSGTWVNREERYAWRPGYWVPGQENWIWIPAHYQWTRRGYVFIDGYWDYNIARRGVVFAPVRFQQDYYSRPNFSYTPVVVIALNVFVDHLFVRPRYNHYYFGDYYEPRYRNEGFYAACNYRSARSGYDPIYTHYRWEHRDDRDWERNRRQEFDYYRDNRDARPAHTWAALQARPMLNTRGKRSDYQFAQPFKQYVSRPDNKQRFQTVSMETRNNIVVQNKQVMKMSKERRQIESRSNDNARQGDDKRIVAKREKFEKSPVFAKHSEASGRKGGPPPRLDAKIQRPNIKDSNKSDDLGKLTQKEQASDPNGTKVERPVRDKNGKLKIEQKDRNNQESRTTPKTDNNRDGRSKNSPTDRNPDIQKPAHETTKQDVNGKGSKTDGESPSRAETRKESDGKKTKKESTKSDKNKGGPITDRVPPSRPETRKEPDIQKSRKESPRPDTNRGGPSTGRVSPSRSETRKEPDSQKPRRESPKQDTNRGGPSPDRVPPSRQEVGKDPRTSNPKSDSRPEQKTQRDNPRQRESQPRKQEDSPKRAQNPEQSQQRSQPQPPPQPRNNSDSGRRSKQVQPSGGQTSQPNTNNDSDPRKKKSNRD